MASYAEVADAVKKLDNTNIDVIFRDLAEFITKETRTNKGKYKVELTFDAKEMLRCEGIPLSKRDCIWTPYILFIKQDWEKVDKEKSKVKK